MQELFHLCPEAVGATTPEERHELRKKWFTQALKRKNAARVRETETGTEAASDANDAQSPESLAREPEALLEKRASSAPHIANPPKPLRDMRRSDEHREAFVGRKTRERNAEHWISHCARSRDPSQNDRRGFCARATADRAMAPMIDPAPT